MLAVYFIYSSGSVLIPYLEFILLPSSLVTIGLFSFFFFFLSLSFYFPVLACGRRQGWDVSREQHWNVYYLGWNRSPAQVGCIGLFSMPVSLFLFVNKFICNGNFYMPDVSAIIWCLSFSLWLITLTMISSRSIHIASSGIIFFFFMTE